SLKRQGAHANDVVPANDGAPSKTGSAPNVMAPKETSGAAVAGARHTGYQGAPYRPPRQGGPPLTRACLMLRLALGRERKRKVERSGGLQQPSETDDKDMTTPSRVVGTAKSKTIQKYAGRFSAY